MVVRPRVGEVKIYLTRAKGICVSLVISRIPSLPPTIYYVSSPRFSAFVVYV